MGFVEKLNAAIDKNNSLLCVGLDSDSEKIPQGTSQFEFNKQIIDSTAEFVCAYKPNSAFYEALGAAGIEQLKQTCDYLRTSHPELPIILDAKRGDIGNTNVGYAKFAFDYLGVDALTLHPYLGGEALEPFFDYKDKGLFVLAHTTNLGASEFQNQEVAGRPLYLHVVETAMKSWNKNGNIMFVAGAAYPQELADIRQAAGEDTPLLVPGIGAQGGDVAVVCKAGLNKNGAGIIVNSSREIIFSDNPAQAAQTLRDEINSYRS